MRIKNFFKKLRFEQYLAIATFICALTSLLIRANQSTNIYLENPPIFQTQHGEWKVGYWPNQARLLTVDQVVANEKKKDPNADIDVREVRRAVYMNEFTPPALPVTVKYVDFGFSPNYVWKKIAQNP